MSNLNFWGKLNKLREEIKLDDERKLKIRNFLANEIENAMQAKGATGRKEYEETFWNRLVSGNFNFRSKFTPVLAGLLIAIVLGGGVSFAAEKSLPGDIFYPIKVNFNEEVRGALTVGAKAKAEWEAERALRRLEEAEQLAAQGKMNAGAQAAIEQNFETHSDRVREGIAKFQAETNVMAAADINSKFETSLRAHEQILKQLGDEAGDDIRPQVRLVEAKVKARLESTVSKRSELDMAVAAIDGSEEAQAELKVSALAKIDLAEKLVDSLDNFVKDQNQKIGTETAAEANSRIKNAHDIIVEAKAAIDANSFGGAFNLAEKAIRVAEEARVLVNAGAELKIKGRLFSASSSDEGQFDAGDGGAFNNPPAIKDGEATSSINVKIESSDKLDSGEDQPKSTKVEGEDKNNFNAGDGGIRIENSGKLKINL